MKDKTKSKTTMLNVMRNESPVKKQAANHSANIQSYKCTPEYVEALKQYNSQVTNLDENYTRIKPLNKIIVRCFVHEPRVSESGLITPMKQLVDVTTNSGAGVQRVVESDWPYRTKGVVVAVPDNYPTLQAGDIIQMTGLATDIKVMGASDNAFLMVRNGYVQVDSENLLPPQDITDADYGYILISMGDVVAKL